MAPVPPPVEAYERAARLYCEMRGLNPDQLSWVPGEPDPHSGLSSHLEQVVEWRYQAERLRDHDIRRMALERERVVWPPDPSDPWG